MKPRLVEDWKHVHKWYSTWLASVSASVGVLAIKWPDLPTSWTSSLPHWVHPALGWIAVACAFLVPPARIIKQGD